MSNHEQINQALSSTEQQLQPLIVESHHSSIDTNLTNIFLGIGLLSNGHVSEGLGISAIAMLSAARQLQKNLSQTRVASQIQVLVADIHSLEHTAVEHRLRITEVASQIQDTVKHILRLIGSENFTVFLASEHPVFSVFHQCIEYQDRQVHDLVQAKEKLNAGIKIGWQSKRKVPNGSSIRDEKFFDDLSVRRQPDLTSFSFLRTMEGVSPATRKGEHLFIPPYFGDMGFIFGAEVVLKEITQDTQMRNHLHRLGLGLKANLDIHGQSKNSTVQLLQDLIDALKGHHA